MKFKQPLPYTGIDGQTKIVRESVAENENDNQEGRIGATPFGVFITGDFLIRDWEKDGTEFAKQLTGAWKDHMRLKPKLTANIPAGFKP